MPINVDVVARKNSYPLLFLLIPILIYILHDDLFLVHCMMWKLMQMLLHHEVQHGPRFEKNNVYQNEYPQISNEDNVDKIK